MSRSFKAIPSLQVQEEFSKYEHFDGELIEGSPNDTMVYNRTQSHIMSEDKPGDITYFVFDYTRPDLLSSPFHVRFERLLIAMDVTNVRFVEHTIVENEEELLKYEGEQLDAGFEGIIMRSPVGIYKQGRGTWREGIIYKLKRFRDDEGIIIGLEEGMLNQNEQKKDALGYAERSTSKEGMVRAGTLGRFIVLFQGQDIQVAPGAFDHSMRKRIWEEPDKYIGKILKFRHFTHGIKDKPRFPRAIGLRSTIDM
jgi:DNA ligase-1